MRWQLLWFSEYPEGPFTSFGSQGGVTGLLKIDHPVEGPWMPGEQVLRGSSQYQFMMYREQLGLPCSPALIHWLCQRPDTKETTDFGTEHTEQWVKITLFSFLLIWLWYLLTVHENWLIQQPHIMPFCNNEMSSYCTVHSVRSVHIVWWLLSWLLWSLPLLQFLRIHVLLTAALC